MNRNPNHHTEEDIDVGEEQEHDSIAPCVPKEGINRCGTTGNVLRMSKYTLNLLPNPFATEDLAHGSDPTCDH